MSTASTTNSTGGGPITGYFKAPVNNALLDPLQGFDADVWVVDQATGRTNMVGRFTSIQITVRDATEPYLELNQRVPRNLNGEVQIGFVLERGMVDTRILQAVFGFNALTREMRFNRSPRMQISFDLNAPELDEVRSSGNNGFLIPGADSIFSERRAKGQYRLTFCKPDSLTIGAMAGRSVIATRLEGLAEGIEYIDESQMWAGLALQGENAVNALVAGGRAGSQIYARSNPLGLAFASRNGEVSQGN